VVAVVGGGVLGLLVAGLASDIAGTKVTVIDINARRAAPARALGAEFTLPEAAPQDCDIVIHTSASEPGLRTALACAGMEATIVEASWFGTSEPSVPLGGAFHARRLTLKCSQVGMVSAGRRVRWSYARRLDAALALLCNDKYDALITAQVPFSDLPSRISEILDPAADGLATAVSYL
jgi:threonine dehydrogenase-like Zn-dependent dehydrogenase